MNVPQASLAKLLSPASIAIVGASDNPDKIGGRPIHYMRRHGYRGRVFPINPQRESVQGERAWRSLGDLPEVPELAIIAVAGDEAVRATDACAAMGVGAAIVIAAGFSETGAHGRILQDAMTRRARAAGMRIVGPNSQGLANFGNGAITSFSTMFLEVEPADGPVAVLSQSGGMSAMMYGLLRQRGMGVRHVHATGNEADVTVAELAEAVLDDPEVRVALLYLESIADAGPLARAAAKARERGIPLIAVKAGRSSAGARAAASHTGALASEDRAVDAFFERHAILRARDPQELARYAELALRSPLPGGERVVIVSNSGASCVLASDAAEAAGLQVPTLAQGTQRELARHLPGFATTDNPVDITAALLSNNGLFGEALPIIAGDAAADTLLVDIPVAGRGYDVAAFARDAAASARQMQRPLVVVAWQDAVARAFREEGIAVFAQEQEAMQAVSALAWLRRAWRRPPLAWPAGSAGRLPVRKGMSSEAQALGWLRDAGVAVVEHRVCGDADAAVAAWRELGGAVAVKACSADVPHKSEHGLVGLGLDDEAGIRAAVAAQRRVLDDLGVGAAGWLVARMVPALHEFAVGVNVDPVFGPVVMVGAGGKYVESLDDVAVLLPPFDEAEVLAKVVTLRIGRRLAGLRGDAPADAAALARLAVDLAKAAVAAGPGLRSIDVNPVRVRAEGQGAIAVDALIECA
ncbi:acetate--CoA ligase family protein [Verticiella sediminum]|uniref:Acetate--CoA ligase family protein n=1 Tax=Verticiella sediminum TaxID=1247510 RepID=A0A556B1B1_9BURK|nr:acetate--CoA ligase family protein [Verticiella sediminum]TSH98959.1 acetate--CoA ligase family protein [Verticiella sediminum]